MKRTYDQQRLPNGSISAPAQPQSVSAPVTPRPETPAAPQALEAAYANYGYGPRHPSHELNRQAEAQAAAARNAEYYAAQAQAAAQQQAIAAQQLAQAYHQSRTTNASGMPSLYPSYRPADQFPSQTQPQPPLPMGQVTPPSKRPRFDYNNGASLPAAPASLPPMPQQPNAVRPVVDPSRGPPQHQNRRNVFPPPYSGPTGPSGPPFMPAQPFPPMQQGFAPQGHSPPFPQGAFPPMTGPMRGGPPMRGHMMNDRGGRGRGGPPLPPQRMTTMGRGQSQRGRARDRGRGARQARGGRQAQPDEKRRAFSDFRIISIEIDELDWSWQGEPFTREPSTAIAAAEEAQARGKHKREEDSEDEREAAKKVRAHSTGREEDTSAAPSTSTAGHSPQDSVQSGITTPMTPAEPSSSKLPDEPSTLESSCQEAAVSASRAEDDDVDGVPAEGSEHSRGISPSPSVASTVGKAKKSGSGPGREGNRLRIYFGAPVEIAKQPRRPPIPTRPPISERTGEEELNEEAETAPAFADLPPDLAAAAEAASSEPGPLSKPIEAPKLEGAAVSEAPGASPDRISISYAKNTRRMIIDAAIIEVLRLHRSEHRIELVLNVAKSAEGDEDEETIFKGLMIEALDVDADDFVSVDRQAIRKAHGKSRKRARSESVPADAKEDIEEDAQDELLPPLHRLRIAANDEAEEGDKSPGLALTKLSFSIVLDKANPLGEPKWARTGQVDEWIAQAASRKKDEGGWRGKIQVMDPEPPPTFQHALDTWVESSQLDFSRDELRKFASTHMQQPENVIEVLLRVIRGDARQERPSHTLLSSQPPAVAKMAHELKAPYASHQTHVSLATYQLYKMAVEQSGPTGSPARQAADKRVGEIVRALPYHLVFRVLDSMAKESLRL